MTTLRSAALTVALAALWLGQPLVAEARDRAHRQLHTPVGSSRRAVSDKMQRGTASVYASNLHGRRTADGSRFDANSNAAASKTLPLGTTAQVTNLENGRTATVEVRDRGPHRRGRIIDVSPGTASALGMDRHGTASVSVVPIAPP